jgi:2-haloacid dehalogenase
MKYELILMDADETLFDFQAGERNAIEQVVAEMGLSAEGAAEKYHEINQGYWKQYEQGLVTQPELRRRRFEDFADWLGVFPQAEAMSERYPILLGQQAILFPDALQVVRVIAQKVRLVIVTNGHAQVQRSRFGRTPLLEYASDLVISEEVGFNKPDPRILYTALERSGGVRPERALMVGDSLTSDMRAGLNAGVDTCWYNPTGQKKPCDMAIDYVVDELKKIVPIALQN